MRGIFHFWFRLISIIKVYIFVQQNVWTLTLKCHNSFQNQNNRTATHGFDPRSLIFKLQRVLEFNDICLSWSSPKTDLVTYFLNSENQSFENVSIVTLKKIFDIPLLNKLFTSFVIISLIELKTFHYLIRYFFSQPNYLFNWNQEHLLKEHRCNFKIEKITYSKSQSVTIAKISLHRILKCAL